MDVVDAVFDAESVPCRGDARLGDHGLSNPIDGGDSVWALEVVNDLGAIRRWGDGKRVGSPSRKVSV